LAARVLVNEIHFRPKMPHCVKFVYLDIWMLNDESGLSCFPESLHILFK